MKILDVCAFYSPQGGGVRTYIDQKIRLASQLGHEVVIVAPGDEYAVLDRGPGARIVTTPSLRTGTFMGHLTLWTPGMDRPGTPRGS
jgi:alpha-1,6-mannosyltransferase